MPVDVSQPVYPPVAGEAVEAVWGDSVSEHVVQRFTSLADRDAKWLTPPDGAKCWVPFGTRSLEFTYQAGAWWPRGEALYVTMTTPWSVPVDAAWWGIPFNTVHLLVGSWATVGGWTAPVRGLVEITVGATLVLGSYLQGDYHFESGVNWIFAGGSTILSMSVAVGKFSSWRNHGTMWLNVNAGDRVEPAVWVAGATGVQKQIWTSSGVGMAIKYIGRSTV